MCICKREMQAEQEKAKRGSKLLGRKRREETAVVRKRNLGGYKEKSAKNLETELGESAGKLKETYSYPGQGACG